MTEVSYTRGYGALSLNKTQAEWDEFIHDLTIARDALILMVNNDNTRYAVGAGEAVYQIILDFLTDSNGDALSGVDSEVVAWVEGAIGVNTNTGEFGKFIQRYTVEQFTIRGGDAGDAVNFTQEALE